MFGSKTSQIKDVIIPTAKDTKIVIKQSHECILIKKWF